MKWKGRAWAPVIICSTLGALGCACAILSQTLPRFTAFRRLEWILYDWRLREAAASSPAVSTNLGFIEISDDTLRQVQEGKLGYHFGPHWPRQLYGRILDELYLENVRAVGFDILFPDRRDDHGPITIWSNAVDAANPEFAPLFRQTPSGQLGFAIQSDEFFRRQLARSTNAVLGAEGGNPPHEIFRTNAWAMGDIYADRDIDGILRRAHPYSDVYVWHQLIVDSALEWDWDLSKTEIRSNILVFHGTNLFYLRLDASNRFDTAVLWRMLGVTNNTSLEPPFTKLRAWHMGIQLAARELNLDLKNAEIDERNALITLRGPGVVRTIPLDSDGRFYIDWSIKIRNPLLVRERADTLLSRYEARRMAPTNTYPNTWAGKLAIIGTTATGMIRDFGATPLEKETYLTSQHWNVANSVLLNRFIQPTRLGPTLVLIVVFTALSGILTWNLRTLHSVSAVVAIAGAYVVAATWAFIQYRLFLPIVLPIGGALLTTHVTLITWLVAVEQKERRRTKDIFSKIVSPDIVKELLDSETLQLEGARRRVTVYFADVRGFTELTDTSQQRAEKLAAERNYTKEQAEGYFDRQAGELLQTVNSYLAVVAGQIKDHGGTLDKYIGDCVMAFWGAPVANRHHARDAVEAAIGAQRAIYRFNQERLEENKRREEQNAQRGSGEDPLPPLSTLSLGSGINTGSVTVGLMGSDANLLNYTVFGREVNLASRLESISGRARIIIGEETYRELLGDAPNLARLCRPQTPVTLKGFREAMKCYEVEWQEEPGDPAANPAAISNAPPKERESCV